jgi:hypothetical protein
MEAVMWARSVESIASQLIKKETERGWPPDDIVCIEKADYRRILKFLQYCSCERNRLACRLLTKQKGDTAEITQVRKYGAVLHSAFSAQGENKMFRATNPIKLPPPPQFLAHSEEAKGEGTLVIETTNNRSEGRRMEAFMSEVSLVADLEGDAALKKAKEIAALFFAKSIDRFLLRFAHVADAPASELDQHKTRILADLKNGSVGALLSTGFFLSKGVHNLFGLSIQQLLSMQNIHSQIRAVRSSF